MVVYSESCVITIFIEMAAPSSGAAIEEPDLVQISIPYLYTIRKSFALLLVTINPPR